MLNSAMLDLHDLEKGTSAPPKVPSAACLGGSPLNGGLFAVGEKVRYWSARHHRWVDAHVQRVNRGPGGLVISYDLTAKAQAEVSKVRAASTPSDEPPPPSQLSGKVAPGSSSKDGAQTCNSSAASGADNPCQPPGRYEVGERVEYWSTSAGRWVSAKVLKLNAELGQCDLDLKPGAPLVRLRKATGSALGAPDPSEAPAWPSSGPKGTKVAPPPPLSCGFKDGDQVQYWSETKDRWLEAVVQRIREKDGTVVYDLDCKKGTPADRVRPSLVASQNRYQVGEEVEYWSTSAGGWLPAKVLRLYMHLGQCDLDVKPGAPLGRLRRVAGSSTSELPLAEERQRRPTNSTEAVQHDDAGGLSSSAPQKECSDPLQLNQLLKESTIAPSRQPPPCAGEWCSGAKTMRIFESGGRLVVDMGPLTPTLVLVAMTADSDAWPKQWSAVRKSSSGRAPDTRRALYILELPALASETLLVKRPVGEGQIEFVRAPQDEELTKPNPQSGSDGPSDPSPQGRTRSRSPRQRGA